MLTLRVLKLTFQAAWVIIGLKSSANTNNQINYFIIDQSIIKCEAKLKHDNIVEVVSSPGFHFFMA